MNQVPDGTNWCKKNYFNKFRGTIPFTKTKTTSDSCFSISNQQQSEFCQLTISIQSKICTTYNRQFPTKKLSKYIYVYNRTINFHHTTQWAGNFQPTVSQIQPRNKQDITNQYVHTVICTCRWHNSPCCSAGQSRGVSLPGSGFRFFVCLYHSWG